MKILILKLILYKFLKPIKRAYNEGERIGYETVSKIVEKDKPKQKRA